MPLESASERTMHLAVAHLLAQHADNVVVHLLQHNVQIAALVVLWDAIRECC